MTKPKMPCEVIKKMENKIEEGKKTSKEIDEIIVLSPTPFPFSF